MPSIRDRGLRQTFAPMNDRLQQGDQLKEADVQALIASAQDGPGVTKTEAKDLGKILAAHGADMDPGARATLEAFVDAQTSGTQGGGGQTSGGQTSGGASLLDVQIRGATLRKALTGEDGGEAILADKSVSRAEAERLIALVEQNGVVSSTEKRDLRALLASPDVAISGPQRQMLEQLAGAFHEPPPHQTVAGGDVLSAHVDASARYREQGVPTALLRQAGVPAAVCDVLDRADALSSGDSSGAVGVRELEALEAGAALLPAELAALPAAYKLLEVTELDPPDAIDTPSPLAVEDLSTRPASIDVDNHPVAVSELSGAAATLAQRALLVRHGQGADLSKVTMADVQYAIDNDHGESTPADRASMQSSLLDSIRLQALADVAVTPQAKALVPELGQTSQPLIDRGALKLSANTYTKLGGGVRRRAVWSVMVQSHARGASAHYPSAIPKSSDVDLQLSRINDLDIDIPPGHKLLLISKNGRANDHRVFDAGELSLKASLRPEAYRAVLMKDGEVVEEAALDLSAFKDEQLDVSAIYGFDLETPSGESVGLRRANQTTGTADSGWNERIVGTQGATGHSLPGTDTPVTLEPGRYEGAINIAYNQSVDFALDVLSPTVLECTVGDKTFRLFPTDRSSGVFEGHLDDEGTAHTVFRFDADDNKLSAIQENMNTYHAGSGWYADVKSRQRGVTVLDSASRTR